MNNRKYGWRPDLPDKRDLRFSLLSPAAKLPPKVDLRNNYQVIYDQGALGSCTANAIAMAFDFERIKQKLHPLTPSRLFIYYNERTIEGSVAYDAGAAIRDGIKSIAKQGVCPEKDWPYIVQRFRTKPSANCYHDAKKTVLKKYLRLNNLSLTELKGCLAEGFGFVFGFSVYESFESPEVAKTGKVPMPGTNDSFLGGHAVFAVGYDDNLEGFIVRNSWGNRWGLNGHFILPYAYMTNPNLADDFWTLRLV